MRVFRKQIGCTGGSWAFQTKDLPGYSKIPCCFGCDPHGLSFLAAMLGSYGGQTGRIVFPELFLRMNFNQGFVVSGLCSPRDVEAFLCVGDGLYFRLPDFQHSQHIFGVIQ
jgi:hypothetical protein